MLRERAREEVMLTRARSVFALSAVLGLALALSGARVRAGGAVAPKAQTGSAFTYQGRLRKDGAPVNAVCYVEFSLHDAQTGGAQVGTAVVSPSLQVANGQFTVDLDFGWGAFSGEARWLETAIGCGEAQATLTPRTALRPAPYAFALPGLRTAPGTLDWFGQPTMSVIGGVLSGTNQSTVSADSWNSVIGGGTLHAIGNGSLQSVIAGGGGNLVTGTSPLSAVGGGLNNRVDGFSQRAAIGGGSGNVIDGGSFAFIGGGSSNGVRNSTYGVAAGGVLNVVTGSLHSAILGGAGNTVELSGISAIGGGQNNRIAAGSGLSSLGGGHSNMISASTAAHIGGGSWSVVEWSPNGVMAGGYDNQVSESDYGVVAGGIGNRVMKGDSSAIGGGKYNVITQSAWSHVGGGGLNVLAWGNQSVIGGGRENRIDGGETSVIGGGYGNVVRVGTDGMIAGGRYNVVDNAPRGAIGGGFGNVITAAQFATIPGGRDNRVEGDYALAAGRRARALHDGAFVWADSADADVASSGNDQFIIRAAGGVGVNTTTPVAGGVVVDGRVIAGGPSDPGMGTEPFTAQGSGSGIRMFDRAGTGLYAWVVYPDTGAFRIWRDDVGDVIRIQPSDPFDLIYIPSSGASLTAGGAWTNASDRARKTGFAPVDPAAVLDALSAMPLTSWRYRAESPDVRHIGPTAQDFRAAFGLGDDDTSISTVDADGVALAAIKGLRTENDTLKARLEALEARAGAGASPAIAALGAVAATAAAFNLGRASRRR